MLPRVYLGTMTFGWSQASSKVNAAVATAMVQKYAADPAARTRFHVDTARIYAGGATEPLVAQALAGSADALQGVDVILGSKAHPSQPGGLSEQGLVAQFEASCKALGVQRLEEFYLHQPDTKSALLDSLKCADALVKANKVGAIGLSNYHASECERAFALCAEHGLTKPSVFQGLYNPLNRGVEAELLPVLRAHGCAFVAYNPLAAGLLTGKHTSPDEVAVGRFKDNPNYLPRFVRLRGRAIERGACE